MARQVISSVKLPTKYAQSFGTLFNWNPSDNTNGTAMRINGRIFLIIWNNSGVSQTVTVRASADPFNRSQDIVKAIPAGGMGVTQMFPTTGWVQPSDQYMWVDTSNTELRIQVVEVPPT